MKTNKPLALAGLALTMAAAHALPQLGYYKARYSADKNYTCLQVTSNTKQVTVIDKKITYFEMVLSDVGKVACVPVAYYDSDDTPVDGDPVHHLFVSTSNALCTAIDGSFSLEVAFSSKRIFWTGEVYVPVALPDVAMNVIAHFREKQTESSEFYSASSCPP